LTIDEELNLLDQQLRRLKIEYEIYFNNPQKRPPTDVEWKVLSLLRKFSDGARINFSQRFRYNEMAQRYAVQSDLWRKKSRIREEGYRRPADALLSVQGVRAFDDKADEKEVAHGLSKHEIHDHEIHDVENHDAGQDSLEAATSEALSAVAQAAPWPVTAQTQTIKLAAQAPTAHATAVAVAKAPAPKPAPAAARKSPYSAQLRDVEKDRKNVESLYQALVEAKKSAGEKLGDAANFDSFSSFVKKKTDQIKKQYACEKVEYSVELEGGKVKLKAKAAPKA